MAISLPFKKESSDIFGPIYRPYLPVSFFIKPLTQWTNVSMVVDSGADYTLLPFFYAKRFMIDLKRHAVLFHTGGIGGSASVYLLRKKHRVRVGPWERMIPLGFLTKNDVPPLMGRQGFLETLSVCFHGHVIEIDKLPKE